jgi:7,8-dihydropterin-6-yl-methyl-4-(beta-D-ribofuranosyl)aminobenzene 5'-phosphate synthase
VLLPALLSAQGGRVRELKITVLSTMLADAGIGEWGFAALVEADGRRILFDTGNAPDTALKNARGLGINLTDIPDVILSHNHADHTGGLALLRREMGKSNPKALARAHIGKGALYSRPSSQGEQNHLLREKAAYEAAGGVFVEHDRPVELHPGVWLTGPVPRKHPERNWSRVGKVKTPEGLVEDTIPEDMSLVFDTEQGLVVLSGCGHAGVINTLEYARAKVRAAPVHAAIGGFHLFALDDDGVDWTAQKMREAGLQNLLGAHCTGVEAVYRIREKAGLTRRTCVVGAVGAGFQLGKGLAPGRLAR